MSRTIHFADQGLLNFSALDIFNVVIDIEKYPEFLPWCTQVKIISQCGNQIIADVTIMFKRITASYRSEITYSAPSDNKVGYIDVKSKHGAFKSLDSQWVFHQKRPKQTLIKFSIECEFKSRLMHYTMSMMYKKAQEKVMSAFKERIYNLLRN